MGWVDSSTATSKEFLQGIGTDHAGLLEQGLDRGIARREGC
jgi:hypothetical protein